MKFLHVSFVWKDAIKPTEQLSPLFDIADDWLTYGGGNWIIYDSQSASTWAKRLRAVIGDGDNLLVCEIADIEHSGGWLAQWIWDWILKDRSKQLTLDNT